MKIKKYKICIFAYSFKHKKTNDFINILIKYNCLNVVIAAPKTFVKIKSTWKPKNNTILNLDIKRAEELSLKNQLKYFQVDHKNFIKIQSIVKKYKINLGIISGARIIDKKIIKLFKYGIINFHPGKIPETSGLDSFFWTIKKNINPYVTAHFIDNHVDRGKIIIQKKVKVLLRDNFYTLTNRIYKSQLELLKKILKAVINNKRLLTMPVKNYSKNKQLDTSEKKNIYYKMFFNWKKKLNEFL